jgi:hypothetical protein
MVELREEVDLVKSLIFLHSFDFSGNGNFDAPSRIHISTVYRINFVTLIDRSDQGSKTVDRLTSASTGQSIDRFWIDPSIDLDRDQIGNAGACDSHEYSRQLLHKWVLCTV